MKALWVPLLIVLMSGAVCPASAQVPAQGEVWRALAQRMDPGTRVRIRLDEGQRFAATLIQAEADGVLIQPRTRIPVPVQRVPYERIVLLERDESRGMGAGKAAAIGVASGVGAFFLTLLVLIAAVD